MQESDLERTISQLDALRHFKLIRCVKSGAQASIFKAKHRATEMTVGIKVYSFSKHNTRREEFVTESKAFQLCKNIPGVVQCYETHETDKFGILVLEWCQGESFHSLTFDKKIHFFDSLASFLVRTIKAIHAQGIVHGDLKPENILMRNNPLDGELFCLCDFGLCHIVRNGRPMGHCGGTLDFVAPEIIQHKPLSSKIDTWMVGVILYECATGMVPFEAETHDETYKRIVMEQPDFDNEHLQQVDGLVDFLRTEALVKDPAERKTIEELETHPFIQRILHPPCLPLLARSVASPLRLPSPSLKTMSGSVPPISPSGKPSDSSA